MPNIAIYTRSCNPDLYKRMVELLPADIPHTACDQFQEWWEASTYIHHIMQSDADWVINIDEDAFLTDWDAVLSIMEHMQANGLHYAGMPDGGVCPHRCRSWVVMNPFFNIFHVAAMRDTWNSYPKWVIDSCGFNADWHDQKPEWIKGQYNHDYYEPFSSLFYFMYDKFKPLYLDAVQVDEVATALIWNGKPFINHAWYSRVFKTDPTHRDRILKLYEESKIKT